MADAQQTETKVEPTAADEFAAVFETLNQLGDKPPPANLTSAPIEASAETKKKAEEDAAKAAADAAAAATGETQTGEGDEGLPETDAEKAAREAEEAKTAAKAAEDAKRQQQQSQTAAQMDDDEILKRLGRLIKEPPQEQKQQRQQPEPTYDYAPEEATVVLEYEKEWPDVARAEAIKRSVEYKRLTAHIFTEVVKQIQPLAEALGVVLERTQLQDLQQTVENYDAKLVDDVAAWVKTQPAYLQTAYTHVMQQGTVEEVKDLVDRYRASTGTADKGQETTQSQPKPTGTELPTAAKQAAAKLAPVSTKRTAPVQPVVKDDFEGAFAEALKEA